MPWRRSRGTVREGTHTCYEESCGDSSLSPSSWLARGGGSSTNAGSCEPACLSRSPFTDVPRTSRPGDEAGQVRPSRAKCCVVVVLAGRSYQGSPCAMRTPLFSKRFSSAPSFPPTPSLSLSLTSNSSKLFGLRACSNRSRRPRGRGVRKLNGTPSLSPFWDRDVNSDDRAESLYDFLDETGNSKSHL